MRRCLRGFPAAPRAAGITLPRAPRTPRPVRGLIAPGSQLSWPARVCAVARSSIRGDELDWTEVGTAFLLGCITLLRVIVLIALATLSGCRSGSGSACGPRWPSGSSPRRSSWRRSRPTSLFPVVGRRSSGLRLNPDIWLRPLMVLGTQWYILFNVIAGASAFPNDLEEAATSFRLRGWSGGASHPAGNLPLLRDRCDHRERRLLERQHRRGNGELGRSRR